MYTRKQLIQALPLPQYVRNDILDNEDIAHMQSGRNDNPINEYSIRDSLDSAISIGYDVVNPLTHEVKRFTRKVSSQTNTSVNKGKGQSNGVTPFLVSPKYLNDVMKNQETIDKFGKDLAESGVAHIIRDEALPDVPGQFGVQGIPEFLSMEMSSMFFTQGFTEPQVSRMIGLTTQQGNDLTTVIMFKELSFAGNMARYTGVDNQNVISTTQMSIIKSPVLKLKVGVRWNEEEQARAGQAKFDLFGQTNRFNMEHLIPQLKNSILYAGYTDTTGNYVIRGIQSAKGLPAVLQPIPTASGKSDIYSMEFVDWKNNINRLISALIDKLYQVLRINKSTIETTGKLTLFMGQKALQQMGTTFNVIETGTFLKALLTEMYPSLVIDVIQQLGANVLDPVTGELSDNSIYVTQGDMMYLIYENEKELGGPTFMATYSMGMKTLKPYWTGSQTYTQQTIFGVPNLLLIKPAAVAIMEFPVADSSVMFKDRGLKSTQILASALAIHKQSIGQVLSAQEKINESDAFHVDADTAKDLLAAKMKEDIELARKQAIEEERARVLAEKIEADKIAAQKAEIEKLKKEEADKIAAQKAAQEKLDFENTAKADQDKSKK